LDEDDEWFEVEECACDDDIGRVSVECVDLTSARFRCAELVDVDDEFVMECKIVPL